MNECINCIKGYYLNDQKECKRCEQNCNICLNQNNKCDDCTQDFILQKCKACKKGFYQDNQKNCIQCQDGCDECTSSECTKCKQGYYLNDQKECKKCEQTYNICQNKNNKCDDCTQDFILQKCNTCKKGIFQDNQKNCIQCQDGCDECTSSECTKCKQGYYLNDQKQCKKCEQTCNICQNQNNKCDECTQDYIQLKCNQNITLNYNSQITSEQQQTIQKTASLTSETTAIASTSLTLVQAVIQQSSCGLLVSGLTSQKLGFLLLVKTKLPNSIQILLEATKKQLPSDQFKMINFLDIIFDQIGHQDVFYNLKFQSVNLKYSIFQTSGQGVSIVIICESLFVLLYILQEKVNQSKLKSVIRFLYSKLFSGLIIQYIQLVVTVFVIGIDSQILEFISKEIISHYVPKVIFTLILLFIVGLIIYKIYFYLNIQKFELQEQSFAQITREKVQNETISESKLRRNFMLIFLITQSILSPTIFILLNQNYIAVCVIILIIQIGYIASITILMPFYSKITNIYFLIDSISWFVLYIEFFILNILSTKEDIDSYATELDKTCWAFVFTVQIILLLNPIYLLITIITKIIDLIRSKLQSDKQNSSFLLQSQQSFDTLKSSNHYTRRVFNNSVNKNVNSISPLNIETNRIAKQNKTSNKIFNYYQTKSLQRKYK